MPNEALVREVDSLNEAAFVIKRSSIDKALFMLDKANRLSVANNYNKGLATNYLYEAGIYQQFGYSKKALALYYKSLELSRLNKDTFNIARANQQVANALFESEKYAEAEKLYIDAMQSYAALNRPDDMVNITNSLGLLKLKQDQLLEAKKYFQKALTESNKNNYAYGLKKAYFNLGLLNIKSEELQRAKSFFQLAIKLDTQKNDKYGLALSMVKMAEIALMEKDSKAALEWANAALDNAQIVEASELEIASIHSILDIYKQGNNLPELVNWQDRLIKRQNEVFSEEKDQALNFLELLKQKHDEQLIYEREAIAAKQKAELTYLILALVCIGLAIMAVLAYLWFKNFKQAKAYAQALAVKNDEIEKNAKVLDQLNKTISLQNKSLEENNLMKDKLFSIVSHDLRTPLGGVKGILQLVNNGTLSQDEVMHILGLLDQEVDVVMDMLNNLLDWSKAQLNGAEVVLEPVQLRQIAEENLRLISSQAKLKNISLENKVDIQAIAMADKERLNFVIRNLLMNAVKFTFIGGKVAVGTRIEQNQLVLSVIDNGKGISPDDMVKLFSEEERFTTAGTAKEKGTGLGLKLCNDFIQSIGGKIQAESVENKGSTFSVTLPTY